MIIDQVNKGRRVIINSIFTLSDKSCLDINLYTTHFLLKETDKKYIFSVFRSTYIEATLIRSTL